jgi:A/G-specific adenine glycosylase
MRSSLSLVGDIEDIARRFRGTQAREEASATVVVDQSTVTGVRVKLSSWYKKNRRQLPWRGETVDAYGIWVSEIMLQQTRVETVIPYWRRWMERWPTVNELAGATADEVNTLWAGLGYYSRAQSLLQGAKYIVNTSNGVLPETTEELRKIRGIGPYTAGAISSIAFGKAVPLVDGNVVRVLSR